jgi:cathepsin B
VAAAEIASDRHCIASNGTQQLYLSDENVLECCWYCKGDGLNGCNGGYSLNAMRYWRYAGLVSGGPYASNQGCQPYTIPPVGGIHSPVPPSCHHSCQAGYNAAYSQDKHYGIY